MSEAAPGPVPARGPRGPRQAARWLRERWFLETTLEGFDRRYAAVLVHLVFSAVLGGILWVLVGRGTGTYLPGAAAVLLGVFALWGVGARAGLAAEERPAVVVAALAVLCVGLFAGRPALVGGAVGLGAHAVSLAVVRWMHARG